MTNSILRRFFPCYGHKWSLSKLLPPPQFDTIIEAFAGGAGYSCLYGAGKRVQLYDADPIIVLIWSWLIEAKGDDIRALPNNVADVDIRTLGLDEAPLRLIQKWLTAQGSVTNWRMPPSQRKHIVAHPGAAWTSTVQERLAQQVEAIRGWSIKQCDYTDVPINQSATYIIDAPYQGNARSNTYGGRVDDYAKLGTWCRSLPGQVIVHEQEGANWLDFKTLSSNAPTARTAGGKRKRQVEVVWIEPYIANMSDERGPQ